MSTKTMKKGHGVAAAVALIAAVFTLSVNAAEWFTETAAKFEGNAAWTKPAGVEVTVGDKSLAIDADGAELTYTPATAAPGDVQTVTLKVCFSAAYDDLGLEVPQGGFGLVAYDDGAKTVYAVYNGTKWEATDVEVTDVETATHTITITTDGTNVTYKEGNATIAEIPSVKDFKPTSFSFKGTGVLHDDFTGEYTVLEVPLVPPTLANATVSPSEGSFAPGATVEFTFTANDGYLFANGEKTLKLTGTIGADGKVTFTTEPEIPTASVAKIGDKEYLTLAAAVAAAADDATITLLADCAGNGITIDKSVTIDFAGCTYTVDGELAGSAGTKSQAFQLMPNADIVFKNGKITSTKAKMLVQNYANLTLDNMELDGAGLLTAYKAGTTTVVPNYTLSCSSGNIELKGDTKVVACNNGNSFAMDTYKAKNHAAPNVTVTDATIDGDIELTGGKLALNGGTLNGKLVVGTGYVADSVTKGADFVADAPAGYVWDENGKLVAVALPTATVTGITEEGYEVAVQFGAGNIGVGYDNWTAKFYLTSDVTIGEGEVKLGGNYGEYGWVDKDFTCTADEPVSVLAAVGLDDDISVKAVFDVIKSFKCGVKNIDLKNDATFTLKLVITDGENTEEICSIDNLKVAKKQGGIVPGGDPVPVKGSTAEEAQKNADQLPITLTDEQKEAGLTTDALCNKVRPAVGGGFEAYVEVKEANMPQIESEEPLTVGEADFAATIKNAIPGLYYGFKAVDELGTAAEFEPVGTFQRATEAGALTVNAPKGEGDSRFYKLTVSITDLSVTK